MSHLIEKLKLVSKTVPQPMGFRATQAGLPRQRMLLVGLIRLENTANLSDYVPLLDAVIFEPGKSNSLVRSFQKTARDFPDLIQGGLIEKIDRKTIDALIAAGGDFVTFPPTCEVSPLHNTAIGKILRLESSFSQELLPAVNDLPVDAVMVEEQPEGPLSWHELMFYQRFANLLTKPVLVQIPAGLSGDELKAIWQVGIDGVVIETGAEDAKTNLQRLRGDIDSLSRLPPRKRGGSEALLPYIAERLSPPSEDEEE